LASHLRPSMAEYSRYAWRRPRPRGLGATSPWTDVHKEYWRRWRAAATARDARRPGPSMVSAAAGAVFEVSHDPRDQSGTAISAMAASGHGPWALVGSKNPPLTPPGTAMSWAAGRRRDRGSGSRRRTGTRTRFASHKEKRPSCLWQLDR
jgi:hypothetical protein